MHVYRNTVVVFLNLGIDCVFINRRVHSVGQLVALQRENWDKQPLVGRRHGDDINVVWLEDEKPLPWKFESKETTYCLDRVNQVMPISVKKQQEITSRTI